MDMSIVLLSSALAFVLFFWLGRFFIILSCALLIGFTASIPVFFTFALEPKTVFMMSLPFGILVSLPLLLLLLFDCESGAKRLLKKIEKYRVRRRYR